MTPLERRKRPRPQGEVGGVVVSHQAVVMQMVMARMSRSMGVGRSQRLSGSADFDRTLGRPTICHLAQRELAGQWCL
ncbi:hypothetical protein SEA_LITNINMCQUEEN_36 [Gordonia phage LitninMcQueen]